MKGRERGRRVMNVCSVVSRAHSWLPCLRARVGDRGLKRRSQRTLAQGQEKLLLLTSISYLYKNDRVKIMFRKINFSP